VGPPAARVRADVGGDRDGAAAAGGPRRRDPVHRRCHPVRHGGRRGGDRPGAVAGDDRAGGDHLPAAGRACRPGVGGAGAARLPPPGARPPQGRPRETAAGARLGLSRAAAPAFGLCPAGEAHMRLARRAVRPGRGVHPSKGAAPIDLKSSVSINPENKDPLHGNRELAMTLMKPSVILLAAATLVLTAAPDVQSFQARTKTRKASAAATSDSRAKVEVLGLTIAKVVPTNRPGPAMRFGSFVRE